MYIRFKVNSSASATINVYRKEGSGPVSGLTSGKHTYLMDMSNTTYGVTIDSTNYETYTGIAEGTTYPILLLCGYNKAGTLEENYCPKAKIYSCKIYEGDTLVRDMKPVLKSDGTYGLLDTANGVFYDSQVDKFTGGNDQ